MKVWFRAEGLRFRLRKANANRVYRRDAVVGDHWITALWFRNLGCEVLGLRDLLLHWVTAGYTLFSAWFLESQDLKRYARYDFE